jgi:hypothetical protein
MDYIKKFLLNESGSAEAASSAVMIGMASGISGILNSIIYNPSTLILVGLALVIVFWIVLKA